MYEDIFSETMEEENIEQEEVVQLVCFRFADEEYAINITDVCEVIRLGHISPVPQMPHFTLGVVNIRGEIVPVFDLRKKFGLPEKQIDDQTKLLVVETRGSNISFIVDEVLDNVKLGVSAIDPSPAVKMKIKRQCITGLGELEGRMIIILDLEKLNETIMEDINAIRLGKNKGS